MTHKFQPVPEGKSRFHKAVEWRNWTFGYFWTDSVREICIGPLCLCWGRYNVNSHPYLCDCSACCVGCAAADPEHARMLVSAGNLGEAFWGKPSTGGTLCDASKV